MKYEIIDAIREHYKDDESTVVDCLSWLSTGNLLELVEVARDELISMVLIVVISYKYLLIENTILKQMSLCDLKKEPKCAVLIVILIKE